MSLISPPFKSMHISCKAVYFVFLVLLVIIGSCSAIRPGGTMFEANFMMDSENYEKPHRVTYRTGFVFEDRIFNFLPKGSPIPPSAPSKTHNEVVDSTPPVQAVLSQLGFFKLKSCRGFSSVYEAQQMDRLMTMIFIISHGVVF